MRTAMASVKDTVRFEASPESQLLNEQLLRLTASASTVPRSRCDGA